MKKIMFATMAISMAALFSVTALAERQSSEKADRGLSGVVNINTATVQQLTLLPGIGESIARRIVDYRSQKPFKKAEELRGVKGIGEQTYHKISRFLSVSGQTTLSARSEKPAKSAQKQKDVPPNPVVAPAALDTIAYA
ncbi:MAG: helix-hairpin-helix domain-containing protein [Myxococcales bacterium]|nr:helix-hairpin-helix domain-containing protein [Myxococcales bacterium]